MQEKFGSSDITLIRSKIYRSYYELARVYVPFLFALALAYYLVQNRAERRHIKLSNLGLVYTIVVGFFLLIFFFFFLRDYRKKVTPYKKEITGGAKATMKFNARKYFDPIYNQYLLYHPVKENMYILLSPSEYGLIAEGQELELQSGIVTGIVLAIKINDKIYSDVEEFSFRNQ